MPPDLRSIPSNAMFLFCALLLSIYVGFLGSCSQAWIKKKKYSFYVLFQQTDVARSQVVFLLTRKEANVVKKKKIQTSHTFTKWKNITQILVTNPIDLIPNFGFQVLFGPGQIRMAWPISYPLCTIPTFARGKSLCARPQDPPTKLYSRNCCSWNWDVRHTR